jgi:hypothetical protein
MADIKEIKSIDIAPFTLMSSSIHAILAFIMAIFLFIALGTIAAFMPGLQVIGSVMTWIGISLIVIYPISSFFINIAVVFYTTWVYNQLVPRIGGIKLGLEGNEVKEIPVVPFALMLSLIGAIWAFIIGLFLAAVLAPLFTLISGSIPLIAEAMANATNNTTAATVMPTGALVSAGGVLTSVILIIGMPIAVFIGGFIVSALAAIFYNYLIPRVGGVKLEFAQIAGMTHELKSIPIVPAALAIAVVMAIFGFIGGLGRLITLSIAGDALGGIVALIAQTIGYFIEYFIVVALITIFYNFLAPRIGGVKLDLN